MLITIHKAILHILDFNSGVTVFSEAELDTGSPSVATYISRHLEKSYDDQTAKSGEFHQNSQFRQYIMNYLSEQLSFYDFSLYAAQQMYTVIAQADVLDSADLLVCDVSIEGKRLVVLLKCNNRVGFTHQVVQDNEQIRNDIIHHYAILPSLSQKIDEYAFIDADTLAILFVDKKRTINGEDAYVLSEKILECTSKISPKETMNLVSTITRTVAEKHGENTVAAVSKAKNYIVANTETSEYLDPAALGREVFQSSPLLQQEYMREMENAGLTETVKIDKEFARKKGEKHKIKTDTGIEISFPVDYFQNKDYMEFINNPDGTISIQLKNIAKITNRV